MHLRINYWSCELTEDPPHPLYKDHLEVPGPHFEELPGACMVWAGLAWSVSKRCAPNWLEPGRRIAFHTLLKYSPGRAWKGYCFPKCLILRSREGAAEWRLRVRDALSKNPETSSRKKLTVRKAAPLLLLLLLLHAGLLPSFSSAYQIQPPRPVTITGRQVSNPNSRPQKNTNHFNAHKMRPQVEILHTLLLAAQTFSHSSA